VRTTRRLPNHAAHLRRVATDERLRFRSTQEELPHFLLLVREPGAVNVSGSMEEHLAQLSEALADPVRETEMRLRFVQTFIRPRGSGPSSTERVVEVAEELVD